MTTRFLHVECSNINSSRSGLPRFTIAHMSAKPKRPWPYGRGSTVLETLSDGVHGARDRTLILRGGVFTDVIDPY